MGQFNSLINAAYKTIDSANTLLDNENAPFNAVYKQFKSLQSFWFRVVEDASDSNSKQLEELCVDLEDAVQRCEKWIKEHSSAKSKAPVVEEDKKDEE